jgi:hypothetical protein
MSPSGQCPVCRHDWDPHSRPPLVVPCGHSMCAECLKHPMLRRRCPICCAALPASGNEGLPRNYALLEQGQQVPPGDIGPLGRGNEAGGFDGAGVVAVIRCTLPRRSRHTKAEVRRGVNGWESRSLTDGRTDGDPPDTLLLGEHEQFCT